MKKFTLFVLSLLTSAIAALADPNLPKVEILGKEYYCYEIKKGESLYGISKKYGWDIEELARLNANTISSMEKGDKLYYPTGKVTKVTEVTDERPISEISYEPIIHKVKKGETVYSISRQYNIPLETIYAKYPHAKYGIKPGEELEFPQTHETVTNKYFYYTVKPGDTLPGIASAYNTSVETILKENPAISTKNFKSGEKIRVRVNSNSRNIKTELVEEERLTEISSYKVKKNDTWNSISEETGVSENILKEANDEMLQPVKDEIITVPLVETIIIEKEIEDMPKTEYTKEELTELYDCIHGVNSEIGKLHEVRIALLLDEPTSKKDIDFSRGFLIALSEMTNIPYKIDFKIIDGRVATNTLIDELDYFEPNIIISTADKAFPAFLADYGNTNNIEIVNVFDVKNELYEDNASMVQLLPPSAFFNEHIAENILKENKEREFIFIGTPDDNDAIISILKENLGKDGYKEMSISEFSENNFDEAGSLLIYSMDTRREDVADFMQSIENIKDNFILSDMIILGRPNWVTYADDFSDKFGEAKIKIPSRAWLDLDSREWKNFEDKYDEMFGGSPVKSFPNFAVTGYDVANFFIPATAENGGDFNKGFSGAPKSLLQSDISLQRVANWGGFVNTTAYMIEFLPANYVRKTIIR